MSFLRAVRLDDKFGPFVEFQETLGFVPNLLHAQALLPRVIEAQAKLESAVRSQGGAISRVHKERILLSIAADRHDTYCVALESKILSLLGMSEGQIDDLLNDYHRADFPLADLALLQFCLKLSRYPPSMCSEDIEALRACGFEDKLILEAVVVTALAVYRCTLSVGLGPEPDFGPRKIASRKVDPPREVASPAFLPDSHDAVQRKGPYLAAPYLSPKTFAPFAIVQKSHGFIPNFFRSQTLR